MPSFSDSIFLFVLALLLFGPKKLPKLARELGRWVGEFRRASNEFKMQMEEELRISEQEERNRKIAAMEAAAPVPAALPANEETPGSVHPHLAAYTVDPHATEAAAAEAAPSEPAVEPVAGEPLPIASAGSLNIMPPDTGLPTPQSRSGRAGSDPLGGLLESIPPAGAESATTAAHPDETAAVAQEAHG